MESLPKGIFITGTDTGVGKTVATAAIAHSLIQSGANACVMKPIQTGAALPVLKDLEFVERVTGKSFGGDDYCPYIFDDPLAPYTASIIEKRDISTQKIKASFERLSEIHELVLVEGAGGLLVPILDGYTMADLARDLGLSLIIVARPDLGTLNHTTLTVEYAKSHGLSVLGIVISNFPDEPGLAEKTNPEILIQMTGLPILGVLAEDKEISVEEGGAGHLRESSKLSLSPVLGGVFDAQAFLSKLRQ